MNRPETVTTMEHDEHELDAERQAALNEKVAGLPREIAPQRDLWAGIRDQITPGEAGAAGARSARSYPLLRLAAVMAVAAVSSLATWWIVELGRASSSVVGNDGGVEFVAYRFGPRHMLGPQYTEVREDLVAAVNERLHRLDSETREIVKRNLLQIRQSMTQINAALEGDPENILLQRLLLSVYQEELRVLSNVNQMTEFVSARTEI